MWVGCSNIVIGMSVLDMWSVFCVPYVAVVIAIIIKICTGHVVSVVCSVCGWWDKNIVIGLYVLAMWLVLFLMYVGGIL